MSIEYYEDACGVWRPTMNPRPTSHTHYRCWKTIRGSYHRTDGPAREWKHDSKPCIIMNEYYLNGINVRHQIKQQISIGSPINIGDDAAIVLKHIEGVFYEVLLGNKKILIVKA